MVQEQIEVAVHLSIDSSRIVGTIDPGAGAVQPFSFPSLPGHEIGGRTHIAGSG